MFVQAGTLSHLRHRTVCRRMQEEDDQTYPHTISISKQRPLTATDCRRGRQTSVAIYLDGTRKLWTGRWMSVIKEDRLKWSMLDQSSNLSSTRLLFWLTEWRRNKNEWMKRTNKKWTRIPIRCFQTFSFFHSSD